LFDVPFDQMEIVRLRFANRPRSQDDHTVFRRGHLMPLIDGAFDTDMGPDNSSGQLKVNRFFLAPLVKACARPAAS